MDPLNPSGRAARGRSPMQPSEAFELVLVREILREARIGGDSGGSSTQKSVCSDMILDAVSQAACQGHGMGLKTALLRQLEPSSRPYASHESTTGPL
jgi:Rod binding domain-containing protein